MTTPSVISSPIPSARALSVDWAAKLGHVCTAGDPLIQDMLAGFQAPDGVDAVERPAGDLRHVNTSGVPPLCHVIAVGGSFASVPNVLAPQKVLGFVKVAAAAVDVAELEKLDSPVVNPELIRRFVTDGGDAHATVLPVCNVRIPGHTLLQTVRHALLATFRHFQGGALYDTLEFLVSYGWNPDAAPWRQGSRHRPRFPCPFCESMVFFPRHRKEFRCHGCAADLTLVDYLGLVTDASESSSDSAVAMNLKAVLEHLTLLTLLRGLVERGPSFHDQVLLLRDGPLMFRGGAARLVEPVRAYLRFLDAQGVPFFLAGVEREGSFPSHRDQLAALAAGGDGGTAGRVFVPHNRYILERIKHAGGASAVYGRRGLYGSKLFCRLDERGRDLFVLSLPNRRHDFDHFAPDPTADDLVGLPHVLATLRRLVSRHFPGIPLPIVVVERLQSLSRQPVNDLLKWLEERQSSL